MAIIQPLLAWLSRSLGRVVSSLFGWAVVALFGETSRSEKLWLSVLVAAAAAWPLLLIGVIWPRLATLVLAFIPLPAWVPRQAIRWIWIVLALAVPLALGIAVALRARGERTAIPGTEAASPVDNSREPTAERAPLRESKVARLLRGFPITIGIAIAFLIVVVAVPIQRIMMVIRRRVEVHVPLVTDAAGYRLVGEQMAGALTAYGIEVSTAEPGWWLVAPGRVLLWFGGPGFRDYVPEQLICLRGPHLEVILHPNALTLNGSSKETARAHGYLVEALSSAPAYQTFDPGAQDIERQIRNVWTVLRENPVAHVDSPRLNTRLDEIVRDIQHAPLDYEEWQVVYRQALQLARALRGDKQLLEAQSGAPSQSFESAGASRTQRSERRDDGARTYRWGSLQPVRSMPKNLGGYQEATMTSHTESDWVRATPIRTLLNEITEKAEWLARKEIDLAKNEIRADLQSELAVAKGLAVAALVALLALNGLVVALILALAKIMPGWEAALLVGVVMLVIGGVVGYWSWTRRVTEPLALTRKMLRETAQWAKERLA